MSCKKCGQKFIPQKGLLNYCSLKCRNARVWSEKDKLKKSLTAKLKFLLTPAIQNKNTFVCLACGKEFKKYGNSLFCNRFCYIKGLENNLIKKTPGGYRKNSGRGKYGWYKGYWCQSSYELAWVIFSIDHKIKFKRNNKGFEYFFENKKYKFFPDFKVGNSYIEIKGYSDKKTEEKIKQFPFKIRVLYKQDLKEVFNYVLTNYGTNFIKLYEGNPYKKLTSKCKFCNQPCQANLNYCSRRCAGLFSSKFINKKIKKPNINCFYCQKETPYKKGRKFCSLSCAASYNNKSKNATVA